DRFKIVVDSRGVMTVDETGVNGDEFRLHLAGQYGGGSGTFWKTAECQDLPEALDIGAVVDGKQGKAYRFEGYAVRLPNSGAYNVSNGLTITAWVNPVTLGGFLLSHGFTRYSGFYGEDHVYSLNVMPDGHLWFELSENSGNRHSYDPTGIKLSTNRWQHVAAIYDGTTMQIYIDGRKAGRGRVDKNVAIRNMFGVGRPLDFGKGFHGAMDEVRLYGRALNKAEITALAASAPLTSGAGDLSKGLINHWSFDRPDGAFWDMTCQQGFTVKGTRPDGSALTMTVRVTGDALSCDYVSDKPLTLNGGFPAVPEANWFRSRAKDGTEIQGELWGTFTNLNLYNFVEYTLLERRLRFGFGPESPLAVSPCESFWKPASFTLSSSKEGNAHAIRFSVRSLLPWKAPLAAANAPVVTRPFDRSKLTVASAQTTVELTAPNGGPAIFKHDEKVALRMTLSADARKTLAGQTAEARCVDALSDTVVETLPVGEIKDGACDLAPKPVQQGPYRIEVWSGGKKLGEAEFAVVGPVEQRKVGPLDKNPFELREVDRIECADDNGKHEFYATAPEQAKTIEVPGVGKCLVNQELPPKVHGGDSGHAWMAYRVNNLAKDKPHLLVVEYPDTDDMIVGITILHSLIPPDCPKDKDGRPIVTPQRVADYLKSTNKRPEQNNYASTTCGYVSGNGYPLSGKRQTMSAVFYPADDWAVIQFDNYSYINPKPMRICRITVSEIVDDLPMVDAPHLTNDRIFGNYAEDIRMIPALSFGMSGVLRGEMGPYGSTTPGKAYKWFYVIAERLVKYMRFRGENTWFGGVVRYGTAYYPSQVCQSGKEDLFFPLYARMFEENGLTIVPSLAYMNSFPLRLQDRYTSYDAAQGADTPLQITEFGEFSYPIFTRGRAPNPLHPALRHAMDEMAAEIAGRYKDYPAIKGVMFLATVNGGAFPPSYFGPAFLNPADADYDYDNANYLTSYDDYTMRQFETSTGIKVPVSGERDPRRFAERREWLLKHQKKAWTDFRCQAIADTWDVIAQAARRANPRLELYAGEMGQNVAVAFTADKRKLTARDAFGAAGSAVMAPRKSGKAVLGCYFNPMNGDADGFWLRVKTDQIPRYNSMNLDPSMDEFLGANNRIGAYLGRAFFESPSRPYAPDRPWYHSRLWSCRYPLAGNRGSQLDYAVILSRCTPLYLCHVWVDGCLPAGYEADFREFTSAYRAIPLGQYKTVFTEGYPGITVRSATVGDKTCFYAVNTDAKPRTAEVKIKGKLKERTVGYPALARADGRWPIALEPYALRVFEVAKGKVLQVGVKIEGVGAARQRPGGGS
ncbi:MAG: LamG domain-containing protein, partial [Kiritimatiellae bacterium]|nr:LamG domain-containing protein [Kiritimatiellia bacterium]